MNCFNAGQSVKRKVVKLVSVRHGGMVMRSPWKTCPLKFPSPCSLRLCILPGQTKYFYILLVTIPPCLPWTPCYHPTMSSMGSSLPSHHVFHGLLVTIPPCLPWTPRYHPTMSSVDSSLPSHHVPTMSSMDSSLPSHHVFHGLLINIPPCLPWTSNWFSSFQFYRIQLLIQSASSLRSTCQTISNYLS